MSSDPGVQGDVPLNLISDADLKREADKIRQAKKLKAESDKLGPIGTPLAPGGPAVPKAGAKGQTRKGAITANRTQNAFQELQNKVKKAEKDAADAKKAAEKAKKDSDKKIKELDSKLQNVVDQGGDLLKNPEAAIQSGILNLASKAGPAGLAIALVPQIIDAVLDEFEDGGVFDTRVKEIEEASVLGPIEYLVDINSGLVLFAQSGYLSNEPPTIVNTDRLVAGQMRYFLFNSGDYTG